MPRWTILDKQGIRHVARIYTFHEFTNRTHDSVEAVCDSSIYEARAEQGLPVTCIECMSGDEAMKRAYHALDDQGICHVVVWSCHGEYTTSQGFNCGAGRVGTDLQRTDAPVTCLACMAGDFVLLARIDAEKKGS